ncbi:MAG: helix-turn-helix transcriptional regulator, partial [Solirubrobacteraceae bacterium]
MSDLETAAGATAKRAEALDQRWEAFDSKVIGARVRALREASSLSLRDLAERSGVSAPMLSQVERGETSPTLTVAVRIAAGLELR